MNFRWRDLNPGLSSWNSDCQPLDYLGLLCNDLNFDYEWIFFKSGSSREATDQALGWRIRVYLIFRLYFASKGLSLSQYLATHSV